MTRKHYNDIAARFGDTLRVMNAAPITDADRRVKAAGFWEAVDVYADHAKADNANFDRDRFVLAIISKTEEM